MGTWQQAFGMECIRVSPEYDISNPFSALDSKISWVANRTSTAYSFLEYSIAIDGITWSPWIEAVNGAYIRELNGEGDFSRAKIKFRQRLYSENSVSLAYIENVKLDIFPQIHFTNIGDMELLPEIWIEKYGNGDVSIFNKATGKEFRFEGLLDGETVYVDNYREDIETDVMATYRYDNFNDNYLKLARGVNILEVVGNCKIRFRYQFRLIQG